MRMVRTPGGLAMDARVVIFTAGCALVAVLLFGLAPAVGAWRLDLMSTLRGTMLGRQRFGRSIVDWARGGALADAADRRRPDAEESRGTPAARPRLPTRPRDARRRRPAAAALSAAESARGSVRRNPAAHSGGCRVEAVGIFAPQFFPFGGPRVRGEVFPRSRVVRARSRERNSTRPIRTTSGSVRIPLLRGRWFTTADTLQTEPVAVLSEIVVRRYWNGEDALDRRVRLEGAWRRVVGVVGDVRNPVGADLQPTRTVPLRKTRRRAQSYSFGRRAIPSVLVGAVRNELRAFDPTAPEFRPADLESAVTDYLSPQRFTTSLLGFFALLGLLLAALGVYGVMRYWVAAHMRDIGNRVALGPCRSRRRDSPRARPGIAGTVDGNHRGDRRGAGASEDDRGPVIRHQPGAFSGVRGGIGDSGQRRPACGVPAREAGGRKNDPVTVLKQE